MKLLDMLAVVQGLTAMDFDKSMTTFANHKVWQDVYKPVWKGVDLYVKFQRDDNGYYFTISFKER